MQEVNVCANTIMLTASEDHKSSIMRTEEKRRRKTKSRNLSGVDGCEETTLKTSHPGKLPPDSSSKGAISNEDAHRKGFRQNHGMYLAGGGLFRTNMLSWIHFIAFNASEAFLFICLARTAILYKDDLSMLFETLHWLAMCAAILAAILPSFPNQHRYDRIFTIFGKDVYMYTYIDEETAQKIQHLRTKGEREKSILVKAFATMLLGTCISFSIILPALALYTGKFFEPQRNDGIVTGVPCIIWIPAKVDDSKIVLARILLLLWQGYISVSVIMLVIAQQSTAINIGHTLLYEFKILALAMKTFEKRAKWVYRKERGGTNSQRPDMSDYLKNSLKEAVIHHKILIEVAEDCKGIFYVQGLTILLTSTLIICLSAISLVSDVPLEAKAIMVIFTGTELGNVFVMCYYGQVVLDGHDVVGNGLHDSDWPKYSTIIGKYVLIIKSRLQRPLSLNAAGFTDINLDTYAQVVKSSFSYFSLLQALKN